MSVNPPPLLPPGYRFRPTDGQLIVFYLKKKIMGEQLPVDVIPTIDHVYASSPDKLPLGDLVHGLENQWIFFSTRSMDNGNILTNDGGYYKADPPGEEEIFYENKLVGYMKTLVFHQGSPPNGTETEWIVEEFRVDPKSVEITQDDQNTKEKISNFVACRISLLQSDSD